MPDFYFQIKGFKSDAYGSLIWPPLESGRISAKNAKEARKLLSEEHGHTLPGRRPKDTEGATYPFIVTITEMTEDTPHLYSLFEVKTCRHDSCSTQFRVIDKYNDPNYLDKGGDFCSPRCRDLQRNSERGFNPQEIQATGTRTAVIYRIFNRTNGQCYIGKTSQVVTLRWYQHLFHPSDNRFHQALKSSQITDWDFSVIESIPLINCIYPKEDGAVWGSPHRKGEGAEDMWARLVAEREQYWISHYDSIQNGYNTVSALAEKNTKKITDELSDETGE